MERVMSEQQQLESACELEQRMWQQYQVGLVESALQIAGELTTRFQRDDSAWYAVSQLLYKLRRVTSSNTAIQNAVKIKRSRRNLLQLVNVLVAEGKQKEADAVFSEIDLSKLKTVYELDTSARLSVSLEQYDVARSLYQRAMAVAPKDADLLYNYATVCRFLGDVEQATFALREAIDQRPHFTAAMLLDSGLRTKTSTDNQVVQLKQVVANTQLTPKQRVEAGYALFKELEDLKEYEEAGKVLFSAATLRRSHLAYSIESDLRMMRALADTFTKFDDVAAPSGVDPVFIVGLPRSGSTLLERLLGQSRELISVGESDAFPRALQQNAGSAPLSKFELLSKMDELEWGEVAANYISNVSAERHRTIDKLPMNVLNVGAIVRAFPSAKIIITDRSPLDNLYAMYKTLFEDAYPFSYDLMELARYYVGYRALVSHWLMHYPRQVKRVSYEALVADTQATMRDVANFVGVKFDDCMLDPTGNRSVSTTASAVQVRQPIHQKSFGSWKRMESDMQVCQRVLEQAGLSADEFS